MSPKMAPTLAAHTEIYFLAEAPGRDEDENTGRPLTGPSGSLLRECIPGGDDSYCSFDNTVRDRPPKNRTPTWQELECCRGHVTKSIEKAKPKLIVGLGAVPLQWMLNSTDLQGMRGRIFAVKVGQHTCHFLPTYHPSFILRVAYDKRKPLMSNFGHCFRMDIQRAFNALGYLKQPHIDSEEEIKAGIQCFDGSAEDQYLTILFLLNKAKKAPIKSVDLETKWLRPYKTGAAIMTVAISFEDTNFSFALDHPKSGWSKAKRIGILNLLYELLRDDTVKIAHNCFAGETEIITSKGLKSLHSLVGQAITVWTENGWMPAKVGNFGKQTLQELTVVPYNRSRSSIQHKMYVTANHNWVVERQIWRKNRGYDWERLPNFIKTSELRLKDKIIATVPNSRTSDTYSNAFIHGLIFADGSLIKRKAKAGYYPHNIRLCGWKKKFADRFEKVTYPKFANGDAVCNWYVSNTNLKDLPPVGASSNYIQDFIEGWQLLDGTSGADGSWGPGPKTRIVTTTRVDAAKWLMRYAPLAGWFVTGFVHKRGKNFSGHTISMWNVTISKDEKMAWSVRKVSNSSRRENVFCAVVPDAKCFTLGNGIYTGNCPFELEWFIWLLGKNVVNHVAWECTQMQAHFIDERRGKGRDDSDRRAVYQSLDFLCKQHFGTSYKPLFKLNKKDMSKSDLGETLIYNGVDTKYTLRLWHKQDKLLKQMGLHTAYLDSLPRQASVALMQYIGIGVDQKEVKRIQGLLDGEIKAIEAQIADLKVVKAYVKHNREFNPAGQDAIVLFRDYLKRPEVSIKEENGTRYSVDKNVLDKIDHPLAGLILQLRNKSVLKHTFVDPLEAGVGECLHPDGKIHQNLNTTFTETGRTSADEINMQNYPQRKDSWVRKQIEAGKGHVLLAFDYGQIEACGAAVVSNDKVLVEALWQDYDIHMDWAIKIADRCPEIVGGSMKDPKVAKAFRSRIKNKLIFPSIYGAQAKSVAGYLGIEEYIGEEIMDLFWQSFHGLKAWQDRLMKGYYENGYVASLVGRRRNYPLRREQAINHPIQCWAAEIICDAMCRLSHHAVTTGEWHIHPVLNIHDDLTVIVPDDDKMLERAIEVIYRAMLSPPYKINVPLSVECSIGKNWYEMNSIGKFWSHRDLK